MLKTIKNILRFFGDMATLHHEMEVGRLKCPKCGHNAMGVFEKGIMPHGVCDYCGFELNIN